jgi:hypothetical protein
MGEGGGRVSGMTKVIDITNLTKTEQVQDSAKVAKIARNMGTDASEIEWSEQPAIIVDETGAILDGHHRVAAALVCGINVWRAIIVARADWDEQYADGGHVHAAKWAADQVDDVVTWGAL